MPRRPVQGAHERGVSLIEALVALAVMAFGMLAVAGLQATMRLNADIAKQRSEAVRVAQRVIEDWRSFTLMEAPAPPVPPAPPSTEVAYASIAAAAAAPVTGLTTNTTYNVARFVEDIPAQRRKMLTVDVSWVDRTGATQTIRLNSVIAATLPEIAATLAAPATDWPASVPGGRSAVIPPVAKDFGDGTSGFKPPQADGGTVAWRFDNVSGLVSRVCVVAASTTNSTLVLADLGSCTDTVAQVLSGFVRFSTSTSTAPNAADAENPASSALNLDITLTLTSTGHPLTPACFDDAPTTSTAAATQTAVAYYCLIYANTARTWTGISTITPATFTDVGGTAWTIADTGTTNYEVCRYTPATSDSAVIPNPQHPRTYTSVTTRQSMVNQNFLVISALWSCPTDVAANPATGNFVNSNTLRHQPAPAP